MFRYLLSFLTITLIGILYDKYVNKQQRNRYLDIVDEFLLDHKKGPPLNKQPILWVHIQPEVNSREWDNFGSRNSKELNKPYIYLCLESIVHHCKDDFNICFIDDRTLSRLLPEWNVSLENVSNPKILRTIGFMRLLHKFGGLLCPSGFLALKNLKEIYNQCEDNMVFCEMRNNTVIPSKTIPNPEFMASVRGNPIVKQLVDKLEDTMDFRSDQALFKGSIPKLCLEFVRQGDAILIDGKTLGILDKHDKSIPIEEWFGEDYVEEDDTLLGIDIPNIERTKYEWFNRLNATQIMHSNFILAKYFVLAKSNI